MLRADPPSAGTSSPAPSSARATSSTGVPRSSRPSTSTLAAIQHLADFETSRGTAVADVDALGHGPMTYRKSTVGFAQSSGLGCTSSGGLVTVALDQALFSGPLSPVYIVDWEVVSVLDYCAAL